MSTPTPTSDALSALHTTPLPDPVELAHLATAFLNAMPGTDVHVGPLARAASPGGAPAVIGTDVIPHSAADTPISPQLAALSAAPLTPQPRANLPPDTSPQLPLGLPPAYASALPRVDIPPSPTLSERLPAPSTPYYFLGESS